MSSTIKAVAFDYGQVISFPPEAGTMEKLAKMAGLPVSVMEPLVWESRNDYDRGTVNGEEYYRTLLVKKGVRFDEGLIRDLVRVDLDSWKRLNPGTIQLMEDVKAAGFKLAILSNMPHDFLAFARANFSVFSLPDVGIFSCELSSIKPERAIYEALLGALDCLPGEVIFFDDLSRNVQAAVELGIRAFLWKDPETARNELRKFSIPV